MSSIDCDTVNYTFISSYFNVILGCLISKNFIGSFWHTEVFIYVILNLLLLLYQTV